MSDKKLTSEEAYDVLVSQVHAPVFFQKLASTYGIEPQTPDEARELLLMAGQLRNAHEQKSVKEASNRTNFYAEARNDLNAALTQQGFQTNQTQDHAVKTAAEAAIQNPLIQEAAIVFNKYMADAIAGAGK